MIETDYNEESFFVRHCYFTGGGDPYKKLRTALKAEIDPDAWATLYSSSSPSRAPSPLMGSMMWRSSTGDNRKLPLRR